MAVSLMPAAPELVALPASATTAKGSATVTVVYDRACQQDVQDSARIAAITFEEVARNLYRYGATAEVIAYRAVGFDEHLRGALAYEQGKQRRPQGFYVARDSRTKRVIGFVTWMVQGGDEESGYGLTDDQTPDNYVPLPAVQDPPGMVLSARQSFVKNSKACQAAYMGHRKRCYIKYLCVDPTVQRTGAGRALLHLVRRANPDLPLYLEAATTPSAEQFYLKLGFTQVGEMMFENALKPLPCMVLEPGTVSPIDSPSVLEAVKTMPPSTLSH